MSRTRPNVSLAVTTREVGPTVSPRLFSQFLEHMSYATVGGICADLVINPTFTVDTHLSPAQIEELEVNASLAHEWALGDPRKMVAKWKSAPLESGFSTQISDHATDLHFPLGWLPLGEDVVSRPARIGSGVRLGVWGEDGWHDDRRSWTNGISQGIYLPLDRTKDFILEAVIRTLWSEGDMEVSVHRRGMGQCGRLGSTVVPIGRAKSWESLEVELSVDASCAEGELVDLVITWRGRGALEIDRATLIPSDHWNYLDPAVLEHIKSADIPELRWPGGNFASYYHWADGVGPRLLRPTRPNYAWGGLEFNAFGTDEYIALCREIGAEPHITVNSGTGSAQEAADWVEYCNGASDTQMGRLRASNGHPDPYNVTIWEVGNENYGDWQGGFVGSEENARRFAIFASAMRTASPIPLRVHACGDMCDFVFPISDISTMTCDGQWHHELLTQAPNDVDVISLHALPENSQRFDAMSEDEVHEALMAQVVSMERDFIPRLFRQADDGQRSADKPPVKVSFTEWGPVGPRTDRICVENAGVVPWGLTFFNSMCRIGGRVDMASHNGLLHGGAIKRGAGSVYEDPIFALVRRLSTLSGFKPTHVEFSGPTYDVTRPSDMGTKEVGVPYVDASAYLSQDGQTLVVLLASRRRFDRDKVTLMLPTSWEKASVVVERMGIDSPGINATPAEPEPVKWERDYVATIDGNAVNLTVDALDCLWVTARK